MPVALVVVAQDVADAVLDPMGGATFRVTRRRRRRRRCFTVPAVEFARDIVALEVAVLVPDIRGGA